MQRLSEKERKEQIKNLKKELDKINNNNEPDQELVKFLKNNKEKIKKAIKEKTDNEIMTARKRKIKNNISEIKKELDKEIDNIDISLLEGKLNEIKNKQIKRDGMGRRKNKKY